MYINQICFIFLPYMLVNLRAHNINQKLSLYIYFQVYLLTRGGIQSCSCTKTTHSDWCTRKHTAVSFGTAGTFSADAARQSWG